MKVFKTIVFIVAYYFIMWARTFGSLWTVSFCSGFINFDSFWGCLIYLAVVGSVLSGVLWYGMMLLSGALLKSKNCALVGFIIAAVLEVLDFPRWPQIGGAFFIILGLILAVSTLVGPFVVFMAEKGKEIQAKEKEKEVQEIYEKARQRAREEIEKANNQ